MNKTTELTGSTSTNTQVTTTCAKELRGEAGCKEVCDECKPKEFEAHNQNSNKMKQKILSISEAFSSQPAYHRTVTQAQYEHYYDKERAVKEIMLEQVIIGGPENGECYWAYCGYNFDGKLLFRYRADAVNVSYDV